MQKAILMLKIPGNWIGQLCTSCDLSVKVLSSVSIDTDKTKCLMTIEGPPDMSGTAIANHIMEIEPSCRIELTQMEPGKHIATISKCTCAICSAVSELGCFLESATSKSEGRIQWQIVGPTSESILNLVNKIRILGCKVEILKISEQREGNNLTKSQAKVMRIAYELGYFEIPKRIILETLASKLDMSKSTLDVMLRRAEKKLVERHFGER
ncbi:MAG TPA: hypothetical protein ENN25_06445 [Euryarchaeota archaeon]|nr:hypothetical protein [Euryarchaeota archaeon]